MTREQATPLHFVFIDDDPDVTAMMSATALGRGHHAVILSNVGDVVSEVIASPPDCIVIDLMMPGVDGFTLCERLRGEATLVNTKIVVLSAKSYDFDKRRTKALGANAFLTKPFDPEATLDTLEEIVQDDLKLTFWGVRGTLPVAGGRAIRHGGNTSCVTIETKEGDLLILDAGTGITELSNALLAQGANRLDATILISHPHWDHINAFPFFAPLFIQGNHITVGAAAHGSITAEDLVLAQLDSVHFPITDREFSAQVKYTDLAEGAYKFGSLDVDSMLLSHPGQCLGYKIKRGSRSICYITDNELFRATSAAHNPLYFNQLCDFVRGTEVLITDCTYTDAEYDGKEGWGHSCVSEVVRLAHTADVKELCLFHHDPSQSDDDIDRKLADARQQLAALGSSVVCSAPSERETRTV
jgi:CheY-like chemotaxis protein